MSTRAAAYGCPHRIELSVETSTGDRAEARGRRDLTSRDEGRARAGRGLWRRPIYTAESRRSPRPGLEPAPGPLTRRAPAAQSDHTLYLRGDRAYPELDAHGCRSAASAAAAPRLTLARRRPLHPLADALSAIGLPSPAADGVPWSIVRGAICHGLRTTPRRGCRNLAFSRLRPIMPETAHRGANGRARSAPHRTQHPGPIPV